MPLARRRSRSQRWPADTAKTGGTITVDTQPTGIVPDADQATRMATEERTWLYGQIDVLTVHDAPNRRRRHASAPLEGGARYELGPLIGRGGMGEVFAAYDAQIGREVAIKRLHPDKITPSSLARFLREARIQGWLDHPSIPSVYELCSDDDGRPFFVMKRLSGITLFDILAVRETAVREKAIGAADRGVAASRGEPRARPPRFTEQQLLRAFVEICLAIEFAHSRGVLHRDLKPANMLLGAFGEVYVLDWGVASVLDESAACADETRHTIEQDAHTEGALGTPGYMSPEQVRGDDLDGRADVYALGCVLFEILVGRRLHPDGVPGLTSALAGVTASPSEFRHDLAPELDELCRRATAADRDARISSARALGEAVQRYLDGDRDLALRRELARAHLENARRASGDVLRYITGPATGTEACRAMREAGRALALDPTQPGAAELVGRLMIQPPARTPAAVVAELEESGIPDEMRQAKIAIWIYVGYACLAPVLLAFGIRDAPYLCALVGIAALNITIASITLVRRQTASRLLAAIGHAAMFGLIARMFTPLFIAPGVAALTLMAYAQHPATRRRELLTSSALAVTAILGVWVAEVCGWLSSTTIVDDGVIRLVPPLDGIAQFPIIPALCCYPILLIAITTEFAYSVARRGRDARRELHVQAWNLRQLVSFDGAPRPSDP